MIEGYCNGAGPADQLRLSRSRAIAGPAIPSSRFQLDSGNIGIVPMKNFAAERVGRAKWDGICIVVLRKKSK